MVNFTTIGEQWVIEVRNLPNNCLWQTVRVARVSDLAFEIWERIGGSRTGNTRAAG